MPADDAVRELMEQGRREDVLQAVRADPGLARDVLLAEDEGWWKGCTPELVRGVLEANPEAVKARDKDGDLPLHVVVAYSANAKVVSLLLDAYPEGVKDIATSSCF